jgi:hypothetical protein
VILVDANLLIYAVNRDAVDHAAAREWWERTLSGTTEVALAWIVILAFIRITTRAGILERPLSCESAVAYIEEWLRQPCVTFLSPGENHWPLFKNLITATGTGGNLTSDAHLASLAVEHGAEIYSADYDFKRFQGIVHFNPL